MGWIPTQGLTVGSGRIRIWIWSVRHCRSIHWSSEMYCSNPIHSFPTPKQTGLQRSQVPLVPPHPSLQCTGRTPSQSWPQDPRDRTGPRGLFLPETCWWPHLSWVLSESQPSEPAGHAGPMGKGLHSLWPPFPCPHFLSHPLPRGLGFLYQRIFYRKGYNFIFCI